MTIRSDIGMNVPKRREQNRAIHEAALAGWIVFFILTSSRFCESSFAQNVVITGTVSDAVTKARLANVNISVSGTPIRTATNAQGEFLLVAATLSPLDTVIFTHVGYQSLKLSSAEVLANTAVLLAPRPVMLEATQIEATKESPMAKELPAAISNVALDLVTAQAAVDLGDLIHRDASVKIDETSGGGKFVSIRGGNPDEVLVIYDGIRLNSAGKNTFDLAQIDLGNLEKIEVIKGSNTVLFGEGAFGGVLNVAPKKLADYHLSAVQRIGTYDAKELGINLHKAFGQFAGAYAFSHRNSERQFAESPTRVSNENNFHTLWTSYGWRENKLEARYMNYQSDFDDPLLFSKTHGRNNILALNYDGTLWNLQHVKVSGIWKRLDEKIARQDVAQQIEDLEKANDASSSIRVEKRNQWENVNLTLTYEYVRNRFEAQQHRLSPSSPVQTTLVQTAMQRDQNSFFGILKNRLDLERSYFRYLDWDLSFRIDWVETRRNTRRSDLLDAIQTASGKKAHLTYKVGLNSTGQINGIDYQAYILNGANVKQPTLQQLFYLDMQPRAAGSTILQLNVEQNIGTEAGFHLETDLSATSTFLRLRKLAFDFAIFRNSYLEKITEATQKGASPRPFNTTLARTTGFESKLFVGFLNDLVDWETALLLLNISDPRVFRFRPEQKVTSDLWLRAGRTTVNCHVFYEGEQAALILSDNVSSAQFLPGRWDVDFSIQRTIAFKRITGFLNLAVRNIRNSGRSALSGFFLQDRRWYASIGARF